MKKEEYIERYGQDSWVKHLEWHRKYRIKNRDKVLEASNRSREKHRDKINAQKREHYYANREAILAKQKEYSGAHREERKEYNRQYFSSKRGRANNILTQYRKRDVSEKRGECTITRDWIVENIFTSKCIYCGDDNWKHLGVDRIDNNLPHTPENVVCACSICNCERQCRKMSVEDFVEYRKTHPRDEEQPLELIDEVLKPDGTIIKVIKKNPLLSA